jgi:CRP-like cAMP-binding protein
MLSTAEKVALLRAVSIFAETPEDILVEVASVLKPLEFRAGETIIHKGDCGDCMYIIVEGRVRAHDGERTLNYLGVADVFGEMALLDAEPCVASVTAPEDTCLLRLDQAPFQELMTTRPEVARGIVRVLNRHLRARVQDMAQDFEYMQQMGRVISAAVALEAGRYDPRSLDEVGQRKDALGQLARVFQRMANEVQAREQRLKQEVQQLRIALDEARQARQVAEITETEYFRQLQAEAQNLRDILKGSSE